MTIRIQGTFLQSAVARRVFFLFMLSAFVPASMLAALSYGHVRAIVSDYAQRGLTQAGNAYATALYDRLLGAHFILNAEAANIRSGHSVTDVNRFALQRIFQRTLVIGDANAANQSAPLLGDQPVRIDPEAADRLAAGETVLLPPQPGSSSHLHWLALAIDRGRVGGGVLVAAFDPVYLWGDPEELSYDTNICVLSEGFIELYCSSEKVRSSAETVVLPGAGGDNTVAEGMLSASSGLFLKAKFGTADWKIVATSPGGLAIASLTQLARTYLIVTLLTLLLVALLSVVQIRRTLVPLERLIDGTQRIAREEFDQPVMVERDDEFGQLANSLNGMAARLSHQIGALHALSEIDQEILSHLDIEQIIARVQARLLDILPKAVIGVIVFDRIAQNSGIAYVQGHLRTQVTPVQISVETQLKANWAFHPEGFWLDMEGQDVPIFDFMKVGSEAISCFLIPIFWRSEVHGVMGIGVDNPQEVSNDVISHARDLSNRIGVAFAVFAREAQLVFLAHHDDLTGLPNRALLSERLQQEMAHARRSGDQLALLFLDLDRFKGVNDSLGHAAGDQLLRGVSDRLSACVRGCDTVARLGGDEFVVLLTGLQNSLQAAKLAEQILALLSHPFQISDTECFIDTSIGVTVFPADGATAEELLKHADIAMYRAKAAGRGRFVFFEDSMNIEQRERSVMERELHQAIARNQLFIHYQPRIDLSDGRFLGAEALLRWHHPELGWVSPGRFIPLAEDVGLIDEIGPWVLLHVCKQLALWQSAGFAVGSVSVNVSGRQFKSGKLFAQVQHALESTGLLPHTLELEVTEGVLIEDVESVIDVLAKLKRIGVSVALDDFGTGYSSITYLRRLPIDILKIDQSFVKDLAEDQSARSIVQAIIAMAHALQQTVVAEGVETLAQADLLRGWGCDVAQGYYFSRPVPTSVLETFMSRTTYPADDTCAVLTS
jgi:diguanylate cyclase (GGDEF)-like protein